MSQLRDYLNKSREKIEKQENSRITSSFKEDFEYYVQNLFLNKLKKLEEFEEITIFERNSNSSVEPFSIELEMTVNIEGSVAQYYIELSSNSHVFPTGFFFELESAGYQSKLDKKKIKFLEIENLNIDTFIANQLKEFN